jgi:hypothetical protein
LEKSESPSTSTQPPPRSQGSLGSSPNSYPTSDESTDSSISPSPQAINVPGSTNIVNNIKLSSSHQTLPIDADIYALPVFTDDDGFSPSLSESSCSPKTWNSLGLGNLTDNSPHFTDLQSSDCSRWTDNFFTLGNICPVETAGRVTPWNYDSTFTPWPYDFTSVPELPLYCDPQSILLNTDLNLENGSSMLGSKDNLHDSSRNPLGHEHVDHGPMFSMYKDKPEQETRSFNSEYVRPSLAGRRTAHEFSFLEAFGNDRGWTSSAFRDPSFDLSLSSPQPSSVVPSAYDSVNDHPNVWVHGEASSGFGSSHRHNCHLKGTSRPAELREPCEPEFVRPDHLNESFMQHPHSHHRSECCGNAFQPGRTSSDGYLQSTPNEGGWHRLLFSSGHPTITITSSIFLTLLCAIFILGVFRSVSTRKALTPYDKALRSLVRLRRTPIQGARNLYSANALLRLEELVSRESSISQSGNFFTHFIGLFTDPGKRRATQTAAIVNIIQMMCGSK